MFRDEDEDDWMPSWFNWRRCPIPNRFFFDGFDAELKRMQERMQRNIKALTREAPEELHKVRVLPDGTKIQEWGPFVYGYTLRIGQDGKPEIREFGNIKRQPQLGKSPLNIAREREPLVDVEVINNEVKVVAELPGVEKGDINLHGTEVSLTISVDKPERSYYKEIELPKQVDVRKARSTFKNGVLEVTLPTLHNQPQGESIKID
jgi:HSP20 family protein